MSGIGPSWMTAPFEDPQPEPEEFAMNLPAKVRLVITTISLTYTGAVIDTVKLAEFHPGGRAGSDLELCSEVGTALAGPFFSFMPCPQDHPGEARLFVRTADIELVALEDATGEE